MWVSRYELHPRSSLNALTSAKPRAGALLRTREGGFADLHPWPELGDEPLDTQLESLRAGRPCAVAARSLELAKADAAFRARGVSAFTRPIPANHFLITQLAAFDPREAEDFTHLKIKVGRDWRGSRWPEGFRLRFDFNGVLTAAEFEEFAASVRDRDVEFVEDPFPYSRETWSRASLPLALDREPAGTIEGGFAWRVLKPAAQEPIAWSGARTVVTSAMDHPLGQMSAAWVASELTSEVCGLLSHRVYEANAYSEALQVRGAQLLPAEGSGFGFDELLAREKWVPL